MKHLLYNRILPTVIFVPVVFAILGYLLSLIISMTIDIWGIVLLVSLILCIGIVFVSKVPYADLRSDRSKSDVSWWFMLALITLPLVVMVPGLWALLVDTGVQSIAHSDFHASLINQIIHGTFPPVNPQVPDLPIGYYWLYHALMAVPTYMFSIAAPLVSVALIYITTVITLFYLWLIVEELGFARRHYLAMSTMMMVILFNGNLFGVFHAWDFVVRDGLEFVSRRAMVLEGEPRLYGIWSKYINYNSMPLALMYFVTGIYASLNMLRGYITIGNLTFISMSMIGGVIFMFVPGFYVGASLLPALVIVYIVYLSQNIPIFSISRLMQYMTRDLKSVLSQSSVVTWLITIGVLGGLLLATVVFGLDVLSTVRSSTEFSLTSRLNLNSIIGVNYPLIPFLMFALWLAIRKNDRISQLMIIATVFGWTLSYIFQLIDNNQYKFVMLTSFYMGVLICRVLYYWMYETSSLRLQRLGYISLLVITVFIWVNVSLIQLGYVRIALDDNQPYQYDGRYVNGTNAEYREMFEWIRENTPPDTLVIQPLEMEALYTSLYSERLPYLGVFQFEFSLDIAEYDERLYAIDLFYDPLATLSQRVAAVQKFRQYDGERSTMILAIPDTLDIPQEQLENLGFTFAHQVENASLYWFRRDGQYLPLVYVHENQLLDTIFTFGETQTIRLEAIETSFDDTVTACESEWITTWWAVSSMPPTDYLMKLVVVSAETGDVIESIDVVPGAIPMTKWTFDTPYIDTQQIHIPCNILTGEYQLLIGMYEIDYDTSEFVADLPVFYQGGSVGTLGFLRIFTIAS